MKTLKMGFIFFMSAIAIRNTAAEPLPFGCYVTDAERSLYTEPPTCYVVQEATFSWLTPANTSLQGLVSSYGDVAASFIKLGYDAGIGLQQCDAAYNNVNANYNALGAAFNRQVALSARLRRACGSKCRRIK
jgi:hypothetical protein